jgi:hypothetical protein
MIRCRGVAGGRQLVPGTWIDDINESGDAFDARSIFVIR